MSQVTEESLCTACNKPIIFGAKGSFTNWIFRSNRCLCKNPVLMSTPKLIPAKVDLSKIQSSLPEYDFLDLLGEGGMGYVYKVRDRELDSIFALKVLKPEFVQDKDAVKRFELEADAMMQLSHPNLAAVYKRGLSDHGLPYLLMEFVEGGTLSELLGRESALETSRAVNLFQEILEAVEYAHAAGIIHRDLKPNNVMVTEKSPGVEMIKVVDFGIARVLPKVTRETLNLTKKGDVFGTPSYMSPEQCMGEKVDARSDIYSLGCMMYEVLSGQPPFKTDNNIKTLMQQLTKAPTPFGAIAACPGVPNDLEKIVLRCLEKAPGERYQTVQELKNDIVNASSQFVVSKPKMNASVAHLYRRRSILFFTFLALGLTILFSTFAQFYGETLVQAGMGIFLQFFCFWFAICNYRQMQWCKKVNRLISETTSKTVDIQLNRSLGECSIKYKDSKGRDKKLSLFFRGGTVPKEVVRYFDGNSHTLETYVDPATGTPVAVVIGKYLCLTCTGPLQLPAK